MTGWPLLELTVILPLAGLLFVLPLGRHGPLLVLVVGPLILLAVVLLCAELYVSGQSIERFVGGWDVPLGIALRADGLAATFLLTTAIISLAVASFALRSLGSPEETTTSYTFWPLFYAMWASLNAVFIGGDLFNLYVALELLTLSAVAMVAYGSAAAAVRYLLFALSGSLAYLLGTVLFYSVHGSLDMALLGAAATEPATLVAAGLMTAGLLAKTALFPLHAWLPPAHGNAPAPASALLSALVVKASFFITVRIWFDLVPGAAGDQLLQMLAMLGAAAVLYGSLLAIRQSRLKLIVAYSTVAQLGYLFFVFPLAGSAEQMPWAAGAWSGAMFHAVAHAFAKAAMFLAAGIMMEAVGDDRLSRLAGLGRALPMTVFAFGVAAVSIMGLPPSGGFMGKYLMLTSALAGGYLFLALVMIVGGLLAAIYLFRPLALMLAGNDMPAVTPIPRRRQAVPLFLALLAIAIGIASALPYAFLQIGRPVAALEGIE
jgi:formate hydrogenlyase subunit 3/multisubunit Na+/H+ antiporter MnhD subunit